MTNNLPTIEQMLENRPPLSELLAKMPAHDKNQRRSKIDMLTYVGLTAGALLVGVMYGHQLMSLEVLVPLIFFSMLTLHLVWYKYEEKKEVELQKQWINRQAISPDLKTRYREDIDFQKESIIWLIIRFCLYLVCFAVFIALIKLLSEDKKKY